MYRVIFAAVGKRSSFNLLKILLFSLQIITWSNTKIVYFSFLISFSPSHFLKRFLILSTFSKYFKHVESILSWLQEFCTFNNSHAFISCVFLKFRHFLKINSIFKNQSVSRFNVNNKKIQGILQSLPTYLL